MVQLARQHGHLSNRAKVRSTLDHKHVFKSVLENPFHISWPPVPDNIQNVILARLVAALANVLSTYPLRKPPQNTGVSGQQGNANSTEGDGQLVFGASQFIIGINTVTRALESQLHVTRTRIDVENPPRSGTQPSPIAAVFVCSADLDPPALVDHIPHLVAACNSRRNASQLIKLVPLPKGSEQMISQILGIRRAAVLALWHGSSLSEAVQGTLNSVPVVVAPWLCSSDTQGAQQLVPTHIKQLRTTAPKDMKCAREQRSKARAAAKNMSTSSRSVHRKPRMTLTTA